jgi:hypothetical protein
VRDVTYGWSFAGMATIRRGPRSACSAAMSLAGSGCCSAQIRPDRLELMARSLRKLAESAPAGSDTQLAYVRAFTGVATSAQDLAFLAALFHGSAVLEGCRWIPT